MEYGTAAALSQIRAQSFNKSWKKLKHMIKIPSLDSRGFENKMLCNEFYSCYRETSSGSFEIKLIKQTK